MKVVILILAVFVISVTGMLSSKSIEGYPAGYLSDCPGYEDEVSIVLENIIETTTTCTFHIIFLACKKYSEKKENCTSFLLYFPTRISPKSLRRLTMTVVGAGNALNAKKRQYTYYQTRKLIKDTNLDFRNKTLIYVGGFLENINYPFATLIAPIYKNLGYNVILLDSSYFTIMEYPLAVRYIRTAAKRAAEMIANLTTAGLNPKTVELVGLSLGGQTISFIAKHYKNITGVKISRLTGLDPAGPCFRNLGPEQRLDQSDADFVDVIATNIDWFGMAAPVGHANFYVNGGEYQPGDFLWMPCNIICSHARAYTLWLAALKNPNSFIAMKCDSVQDARNKNCYDRKPQETNLLGLNTDKNKTGIYFLATHNNFPYYLGEKGLKKENEYFSSLMKGFIDNDSKVL